MIQLSKKLLVVSEDIETLAFALSPFLSRQFFIETRSTIDGALEYLNSATPPCLIIIDARSRTEQELRSMAMQLLSVCALTYISAVTGLDPDTYHEAMEGLGMLPALPEHPTPHNGEELYQTLHRFLPQF